MTLTYKYLKRVHYHETDQMGVVHHSNYVKWFERGRTELMRQVGISYRQMENMGLLLPVLKVDVNYHAPALYDDWVAIFTKVENYSPVRLEFAYKIYRANEGEDMEQKDSLLASGSTVHMWVRENWKPARLDRFAPEVYQQLQQLSKQ